MRRSLISAATRHGLILQAVLARSLTRVGVPFVADPTYDTGRERPDFLIPDATAPRALIEVHRTPARNAFQMKLLRALTAVAEARVRFGPGLVALQVLFGDPERELPEAHRKAAEAIFDATVLTGSLTGVAELENNARRLAEDPTGGAVAQAARALSHDHPHAVLRLGEAVRDAIARARPREAARWARERRRVLALGDPPSPGPTTWYKHHGALLAALSDDVCTEARVAPPRAWCAATAEALVGLGVAVRDETLLGTRIEPDLAFLAFLRTDAAHRIRRSLAATIATDLGLRCFFADVRHPERRHAMAEAVVAAHRHGPGALLDAVVASARDGSWAGVEHGRCWVAELLVLATGTTNNALNRTLVAHVVPAGLSNPVDNLVIRSPRLTDPVPVARRLVEACLPLLPAQLDATALAPALLRHRLGALGKLQKLNPLHTLLEDSAATLGLTVQRIGVQTWISDRCGAVGRFRLYRVIGPGGSALVTLVAARDGHADDKSKEWGARRRAMLLRDGLVEPGWFVIDGEWRHKETARLHRSGWDRVLRPQDLPAALASLAGQPSPP